MATHLAMQQAVTHAQQVPIAICLGRNITHVLHMNAEFPMLELSEVR